MDCPFCGGAFETGQLGVDAGDPASVRVAWRPEGRRKAEGQTVLRPGPSGGHTRPARWCRICEAVLVAPRQEQEDPPPT